MPEATNVTPVEFLKNGDIIQEREGKPATVAHFDRKSGHLEFETREDSTKLINQVTAAIGTVNKGRNSSGLVIASMGVKGVARDEPSGAVPKRPKRDPNLGDTTPALVQWYFKYYPQEAYIRYGVFLDPDGNPVRKRCRRIVKQLLDDRNDEYGFANEQRPVGSQSGNNRFFEKSSVAEVITQNDVIDDGIVAIRATCMTYAPNEVIGGFDTGDEDEGREDA